MQVFITKVAITNGTTHLKLSSQGFRNPIGVIEKEFQNKAIVSYPIL